MALLGQTLGQISPGSKLGALARHLNARGYTKHPLQSSARVPRARQRKSFQEIVCDKPVPVGLREGYLKVVDMWAQLDGYMCVGSTPGFPSL